MFVPGRSAVLTAGLALVLLNLPSYGRIVVRDGWTLHSAATENAGGESISSVGFSAREAYKMSVPATVLAVLVKNGVYPDPYYGTNLLRIPGYRNRAWQTLDMPEGSPFDVSWWFRTEFALPASYQGKNIRLHLDGINYKAGVWFNGRMVADDSVVEGPYRRFDLDITRFAKPGERNCLALKITPPKGTDLTVRWMQGTQTPPDLNTGIWYDVSLTATGPVRLKDPFVKTRLELPSTDVAHLKISATVINTTAMLAGAVLRGEITHIDNRAEGGTSAGGPGVVRFSKEVTLAARETKRVTSELDLANPKLWWPNLTGPQNLYELRLRAESGGKLSDLATVRFGIREVTAGLETYGDKRVRVYQVNGKRILIRGADYTQEMLMRRLPYRDEVDVRYAKQMNFNTLRMEGFWGTDTLRDFCDRYGIMIFDGMNCCSMWERWPQWTRHTEFIAVESLKDQVIKKRNHPSVVQWVFGSDRYPPEAIERKYTDVVETYDGTRPYLPTMGNRTSKIFGYTGYSSRPRRYAIPSEWYRAEGFNWESGAVGAEQIPPIESMRRMMPSYDLWPISGSWDLRLRYGGAVNYEGSQAAFWKRYGQPRSLEEYCVASQAWQLETHRAMLEAVARSKYRTSGTLKYRFNTGWPALDFQYFDYYFRPNGAFYGAEKACRPLHVQYAYDDHSVYLVNGQYRKFENLKVRAAIFDFDMTARAVKETRVSIGEDESRKVLSLPPLEGYSRTCFLSLRLEGEGGRPLDRNLYWLSAGGDRQAHFEDLRQLPPVRLEVSSEFTRNGADSVAQVRLKNPSRSLAFLAYAALLKGKHGHEILPVYWSENYVSVLPGETVEITGTFDAKLLGGEQPHLLIDGWNIRPVETTLASPNRLTTPKVEYIAFKAPKRVGVNRLFEVSVTVKNAAATGEAILEDRQFLLKDGKRDSYKRTALAPGESKRLLWPYVRFEKPGSHTVAIGDHPAVTVIVEP